MLKLVTIGTVALAAAANRRSHPITHEMVNELREKVTWKVHDPETNPLRNLSTEQLYDMVSGTFITEPKPYTDADMQPAGGVPTNFDPRTDASWSKCIHPIRDQGQCGSCWAFGATEALSDRFCKNGLDVILAPQDLVSCDPNNYGCNGGYLFYAWQFLTNNGAVTEQCWPYASGGGNTPQCQTSCQDGSRAVNYQCTAGSVVTPSGVANIQTELYNNGPLEAAFTVYQDFYNYAGGVYYHQSGGVVGGHAIKVIGWGTDSKTGLNYWICANSWAASWGMNGFFWIKQGDCGINDQMYGCTPNLKPSTAEIFA